MLMFVDVIIDSRRIVYSVKARLARPYVCRVVSLWVASVSAAYRVSMAARQYVRTMRQKKKGARQHPLAFTRALVSALGGVPPLAHSRDNVIRRCRFASPLVKTNVATFRVRFRVAEVVSVHRRNFRAAQLKARILVFPAD